jgi:two-component system, OmpR family, phosphate regulon sensor histidine kinase PhoR
MGLEQGIPRWRTVIAYGAAASAWILAMDLLAHAFAPGTFLELAVFNGWFFVVTTAVFLTILIDRHVREIRRSKNTSHSIIDCMADAVILLDQLGNTIRANQAAVDLFAVQNAAHLLKPFAELSRIFDVRSPDGSLIQADGHLMSRALNGETIHQSELVLRRPDGTTVSVAASLAPVRDRADGHVTLVVAVLRDVTEVKRLERLRDEFLSMAAHELKTPVTTLKTYVQTLRRFPDRSGADDAEVLKLLDRQCNRLVRLVQELLELSRLQVRSFRLERRTFDLAGLADEVMGTLRRVVPDHNLVLEAQQGSFVHADPERIQQVLLNLLDNAAKFSRRGSDVVLRVRRNGGKVVASVADTGIGIAAEKQRLLFQRFSQTHTGTQHAREGLGLGLYICREIVSRHDGRIWVDSAVERGSVFHFSLPAAQQDARHDAI